MDEHTTDVADFIARVAASVSCLCVEQRQGRPRVLKERERAVQAETALVFRAYCKDAEGIKG